jgi:hypothetical protein
MSNKAIACLLGLALAAGTGGAAASTAARITLAGDGVELSLDQPRDGANFTYGSFDVALAPGATVQETFDYTIRLSADSLPATRDWSFCTPIMETDCGPDPTGLEQAYASIWMGRDGRSPTDQDEWIDDSLSFIHFLAPAGQSGLYTGELVYTATNTSPLFDQSATVTILAAAFVDATPVPEPAPLTLIGVAGALALLRAGRRRPR